jgi:hypothetical protein
LVQPDARRAKSQMRQNFSFRKISPKNQTRLPARPPLANLALARSPSPSKASPRRSGRSHPLHPHCFAKGVPGEAAPYVTFDQMPARWCGHNHDARAPAHGRRSPLHPRCLRNGGSGDLRLAPRSPNQRPLAQARSQPTPFTPNASQWGFRGWLLPWHLQFSRPPPVTSRP